MFVAWQARMDNRSYGAHFVMYPCSQNPPACNSQ
jgi:hypothetical protein